ncbi:MAG: class I SAM-dependent RNA methyltransferase [Actinomycetes bacterium]
MIELEVGAVAHGGHCVARHEGRVVFVRHALPGERVRAVVTEGQESDRFWRADAVEVIEASPDRVAAPCPFAGPGRCGGCDWQHATPAAQRRLKTDVVREQLQRLAGLDVDVEVEEVPGPGVDDAGLGWRTRVQLTATPDGRLGLRRHRSHDVQVVDDCLIASPRVRELGLPSLRWPGAAAVEAVAPAATDDRLVLVRPARPGRRPRLPRLDAGTSVGLDADGHVDRVRGRTWVRELVDLPGGAREFRVTGSGFWQVHAGAAATLAGAVVAGLSPRPGERCLDLYAGAGLFAAALAQAVGATGEVLAVEGDARAAADARRNLHDLPGVTVRHGRVDARLGGATCADVVVLDPPRTGARRAVVEAVTALRPRAVAYVACDPAALARDVATFATAGYAIAGLRAFDLFPHTHHVECVALLAPAP